MNLDLVAQSILAAVRTIDPETRYEERHWTDAGRRVDGTNGVLRLALGANGGETRYPTGQGCCDLVIPNEDGPIWVESKHAWTWKTYTRPACSNPAYRDHLLGECGNTALNDAREKLPQLIGHPAVAAVGMLVIALDSDELPHSPADLDALERLGNLGRAPWQRFELPRWKSRVRGYATIGIRPYLWLRDAHLQPVAHA